MLSFIPVAPLDSGCSDTNITTVSGSNFLPWTTMRVAASMSSRTSSTSSPSRLVTKTTGDRFFTALSARLCTLRCTWKRWNGMLSWLRKEFAGGISLAWTRRHPGHQEKAEEEIGVV